MGLAAALVLGPASAAVGDLGHTRLVSDTPGGQPGQGASGAIGGTLDVSGDGSVVVFPSAAEDLVPGDANGIEDIVVRDLSTGARELATVSSSGVQADDGTYDAVISRNGRFVAYDTFADNLVTGDTNNAPDVFVHDRVTGVTTRVSVSSSEAQANDSSFIGDISADGRYVVFGSFASNLVAGDTNGQPDVFIRDRQLGTTTRVSLRNGGGQANGGSGQASIDADGGVVAFSSDASNLVAGDTNGIEDVFVRNLVAGTTQRVNVSSLAQQANGQGFLGAISLSDDGTMVAFESEATNLVPGDTNGNLDAFVHDMQSGETTRVSVASGGRQIAGGRAPVLSGDGHVVAFSSFATDVTGGVPPQGTGGNLLYVHDLDTGGTMHASVDNSGRLLTDDDFAYALDTTGRRAVFASITLKAPFDLSIQVYLHDRGASDSAPPTIIAPPAPQFVAGRPVDDHQIGVQVGYWAHDEHGVCVHELQRSVGGGPWEDVPLADPSRITANSSLATAGATTFRVRATDCLGHVSGFSAGPSTLPDVAQEDAGAIDYSSGWVTQNAGLAMEGARRVSAAAGAWARYTFTGSSVAWIADRGPAFGKVKVYLDGRLIRRVGLFASGNQAPRVMFAFTWPASGAHRLRIVSLGTTGHPGANVDAFASLS
jgi:Tol biopolymer transport system component